MGTKLSIYWSASQLAAAYLLLGGFGSAAALMAFLAAHGAAVGATYLIFRLVIGGDDRLRPQLIGRPFTLFVIAVASVPMVGPAVVVFLTLFLRYFPVLPVRSESFKPINRDVLTVLRRHGRARTVPVTEALLIRGLSAEDSVRAVAVIGEMAWQPTKAGILRYMIRLSPYPNVVLMAIDQLRQKLDALLGEISDLLKQAGAGGDTLRRIANLYHEIDFLDLCDPLMKPFYREKACHYARLAFEQDGGREAEALLLVRYLLEADAVAEAQAVYETVRRGGEYFFPQWIAYELELAVRRDDREAFENLDLLTASGGGVFIPERVKMAAKAWKRVRTSAWL